MARARVGERQAGGEAEPRGVGVDADEALRAFDLGDDDEGRRRLARPLTLPLPASGERSFGAERSFLSPPLRGERQGEGPG